MLKRSKPRLAMKYISEWDVIIYDLHSGNPKDIDLALGAFEKYKFEEEAEGKVLILISSVAVWKNTEPKLEEIKPDVPMKEGEGEAEEVKKEEENKEEPQEKKAEEEDEKEGEGEQHPEGEGETHGEELPQEEPPKVEYRNVAYTETEYSMRTPPEDYEKIKEIEDRILELNKQGLKTYVIGAGIIYGNGETETVFNDKFKSAWLQSPEYLTYVEDGENKIPTVHVIDLVRLVKKIYETKPDKKYLFCIDNTEDRRQKALIQAISSGIGTGKIESKEYQVDEIVRFAARLELADKPNSTLSIDLNLRPSSLMVTPEGVEDAEPVEFPWHWEKGLAANIAKVKEEFCKINNLWPIKIFVNGPPLSGKSYFSDKLAEHYNIPHVWLKTLIPELEAYELEENEENEVITAMRNWKKSNDKKRYPIDLLWEMVRYRLLQNDCQQRGFVLDGFPRTYEDAKELFYFTLKKKEQPKKADGEGDAEPQNDPEEEDPDKYKPKFMKNIYPESVIMFDALDESLKEKAKKLPKEVMKDSHYYENHMDRRIAAWRDKNAAEDYRHGLEAGKPKLTIARFFQEKETEVLEIDCRIENFELFEWMRIYIERHGRPYNYLLPLEKLNSDRHYHLEQLENDTIKKKEVANSTSIQKKERDESRLLRLADERFPTVERHMKELDQVKDKKSREYLMKNIVPVLSEGLIEITKVAPIDPIDYLAEYIFKKSNEMHKTVKTKH